MKRVVIVQPFDLGFMINATHDYGLENMLCECQVFDTEKNTTSLFRDLRLRFKLDFYFLNLLSFLFSSSLALHHQGLSAFHEHNPPRPELTQLFGPRGEC